VLLDSCTFLWIAADDPQLSPRARAVFQDPGNEVYLSAVSTWEITVKHVLGRLPLPEAPASWVPAMRQAHAISALPLDEESTLSLARLPPLHRDPFDRMLICQALVEGMVLLTPDEAVVQYPVRTMW
jgi:PIN domain nuclease of toxin-antitoxin system